MASSHAKTHDNSKPPRRSTGRNPAVTLSIKEYDSLLEDLQDLSTIAERVNEDSVNHEDVIVEASLSILTAQSFLG